MDKEILSRCEECFYLYLSSLFLCIPTVPKMSKIGFFPKFPKADCMKAEEGKKKWK
jgi:hypothetical protein